MITRVSFQNTNASVYTPNGYTQEGNKYPLIVFLSGIGEKGDTVDQLSKIEKLSLLQIAERDQLQYIIFAPQLKTKYGNWPVKYTDTCIKYASQNFKVILEKIYLIGISLGGGGVWSYVQTTTIPYLVGSEIVNTPIIKLAAVVPICGYQNNPLKAVNISCPVWAFHGMADRTISINITIRMLNALDKLKKVVKHTFYPNTNHNCWDKAFLNDDSIETPNLYQWLNTQSL